MIAIYDNFRKNEPFVHGDYVSNAFADVSNIPFSKIENETSSKFLNEDRMFEQIRMLGSGVLNVSFAAGNVTDYVKPFGFDTIYYRELKSAYEKGLTVVFASGNDFADNYKGAGVSVMSASPWSLDCGAATFKDGKITMDYYSQYHPGLTEYFMSGVSYDGTGTSYSAPRLSAFVAELQSKHGNDLSQSEIRTALNLCCQPFEHEGNWYRYLDEFSLTTNYTQGQVSIQTKVIAQYKLYLNRNPDSEGLKYWTGVAQTKSLEDVAVAFKGEPEYLQTNANKTPIIEQTQAMYHLWLGRESDDAGVAYWTERVLLTGDFHSIANEFIAGARGNGEQIDERLLF